jgi:DNA repair protein RadC
MAAEGARALSDAELVAVILRSGTGGKDAVTLARDLLTRFGGLRGLLAAEGDELRGMKGLGPAKAAALTAATELARRRLKAEILGQRFVRDPGSLLEYLYGSLADRKKEIFKVIFLNKANRILEERDLFEGTVDEAAVHPREIVRAALRCHATGVILVHNHPSGRTEPSAEDREVTRKIQSALETVAMRLIDHIIVGDHRYFSFREHLLV